MSEPHGDIALRVARAADAAAMLAIYAPIVHGSAISFELEPPDPETFAAKIERLLRTHPWIVAENAAGRLLGYAYATRFRDRPAYDWACETSVYVDEAARGRGVGRVLGDELVALLERQGFTTAIAGIALPNDPSRELHRRLGYSVVGAFTGVGFKFAAFHDVEFWERALGSGAPPVAPPTPFGELHDPGADLGRPA